MSEEKRKELEEMEKAEGTFGESESKEGLLNDEAAADAVGGFVRKTESPRGSTPTPREPITR